MLVKKTVLKESSISGIGLFADEKINKGDLFWVFNPSVDIEVKESEWVNLPNHCREYMLSHSWICKSTNKRFLSFDNDKFTNHSENPNISEDEYGNMYANRDIQKGEEILCNYEEIHLGDPWEGSDSKSFLR